VIGPNVKPDVLRHRLFNFDTGQFGDLTFLSGNGNLGVDPRYKSPYTDQYIVSLGGARS